MHALVFLAAISYVAFVPTCVQLLPGNNTRSDRSMVVDDDAASRPDDDKNSRNNNNEV